MEAIKDLFSRPIDRHIEEVIKVDQADEATVKEELEEYVITDSISNHFQKVYKAIADAPSEPHEGVGIWVSGFFGSGKSSFAKIVGYTVAARGIFGQTASVIFKEKVVRELPQSQVDAVTPYLDVINAKTPTTAVIFDVSMDRGVRTASERITEIMYKALLRELSYSQDFDLAELEISLETDRKLEEFRRLFEEQYGKSWESRRKLGFAVNEASAVLHKMDPGTYPNPDSWAITLGERGRADIDPNLLAQRAFELAERRLNGQALIFIIDEVGQYVSRSVDKMLDLQAVVQAFGKEGKNRVMRRQAIAPCWLVVTSQEKLEEVVGALDDRRIELARLKDRFPTEVDLKQSDISEVAGKRVLQKKPQAAELLSAVFSQHEGRLKTLCALEHTSRKTEVARDDFISLYPFLPYQIELCIDIVSGLRLRRGAQRHIGGSNRTIIKQAQQMLIHPQTNLGAKPVGELVTLDLVYELLYAGDLLPVEVSREVDEVPERLPGDKMAYKLVKVIALLEVVTNLPRTPQNLAAVLHHRVDADSLLPDVKQSLERLLEAQIIRESEEGFKLLTIQEKNWDTTRVGIACKPADRNRIKRELIKEIFTDPAISKYSYEGRKVFAFLLSIEGERADGTSKIPLELMIADDKDDFEALANQARSQSNEKQNDLFWVFALNDEVHRQVEELHCSREMISMHERLSAQGKLKPEEAACLADEKVRGDYFHRDLRRSLSACLAEGAGFFRGVRKDASSLGSTPAEILAKFRDQAIPVLYSKFELGNRPVRPDETEKFLTAANLSGLPPIFYKEPEGLNLVIREDGKFVPNTSAEICREVLDYLKREHSYGNRVTGKTVDEHFQGIDYAWDREVLRLVLAVLLRGGAIEVTHQGRKCRDHTDPACRPPFVSHTAFKATSFAPREALGLSLLAAAARHYEEITGSEVDIEESAIAEAFKKLAADDREMLVPLVERMRMARLPGLDHLKEFGHSVEGVLEMSADDCVRTLAGEGVSYREARTRIERLKGALSQDNLNLLSMAQQALGVPYQTLAAHDAGIEVEEAVSALRQAIGSEYFYEHLSAIGKSTLLIRDTYQQLYESVHKERCEVYDEAINDVRGIPEWAQLDGASEAILEQRKRLIAPLEAKACHKLALGSSNVCKACGASVSQMESEISAVQSLKITAISQLQELAAPEKKVVRLRVSSILGNVVETQEDVEAGIEQLKAYLLKLLSEDKRIVLE